MTDTEAEIRRMLDVFEQRLAVVEAAVSKPDLTRSESSLGLARRREALTEVQRISRIWHPWLTVEERAAFKVVLRFLDTSRFLTEDGQTRRLT